MSHVKQTQQTRNNVVKSTQLTARTQRRDQLDAHQTQHSRPQNLGRAVSTWTDAKWSDMGKTTPKRAGNDADTESLGLLKRSLSKLRIKDATSPNSKQRSAQHKRQPLQPASKIPQATAPPSTTRYIASRPDRPAFVLHGLAPPSTKQIHASHHGQHDTKAAGQRQHDRHLQAPTAIQYISPARDRDTSEVRRKAMQLGIFKIGEAELKERYQFLNEIGTGEWGSVWAVEALRPLDHLPTSAYRSLQVVKLTGSGTYTVDNSSNFRPLAIKLCKRETKHSAAARTSRLWNEFKVLRTLMDQLPRAEQVNADSPNCRVRNDRTGWHPNVVNFYEFLLTPSLAMLVMPKFDESMKVCLGDTLCRNYFQQLLSAVHWLHQHCVCHNDIKVDNLCVTYDSSGLGRDTVTLFDFGFANRYDPAHKDAFMSRDNWGTPEYLSPERCRSNLHDERKSDIWALGITFFEMLTGRTPFEHHEEKFDTKEKYEIYYSRAERGTWLGTWDMSSEMEDLIRKMLRHDPSERIDAAGGLLHSQFDPRNIAGCDSFDELLQMSYEDERLQRAVQPRVSEPEPQPLQDECDDSDAMIEELVAQTQQHDHCFEPEPVFHDASEPPSILASPGVSRAVVATHLSHAPGSPSLSQVGMDSRLTDLMCVSPPWRGPQPPRQGTPIPSAQRNQILHQSLHEEEAEEHVDEDSDEASLSDHSPVAISRVSRASITKPVLVPLTKQSPFRLRLGERPHSGQVGRPVGEQMTSTPLSAPAVIAPRPAAPVMSPTSLPPVSQEKPKPVPQASKTDIATGVKGNVVASLAKKFDASNFLARPPAHVTALAGHTGLGLTVRGQPLAKMGHGHRRSKSYTLTSSHNQQQGEVRHSVRRSTGSIVHITSPEESVPQCARRLFASAAEAEASEPTTQTQQTDIDSATDIGSSRSDTKNAGDHHHHHSQPPLHQPLHSVLAGDSAPPSHKPNLESNKRQRSPTKAFINTPSPSALGEEVIFKKLKRMASLAGMLTKMIDETKSTILSPGRVDMKTPVRRRGSAESGSTSALDISPGLLETPPRDDALEQEEGEGERGADGDISLVSAAYSLDLSGSARPAHTTTTLSTVTQASSIPPSPAQVETMYSSFLLSQNVHRSGSGFLSPSTQPPLASSAATASGTGSGGGGGGATKHRSLATLLAPLKDSSRGDRVGSEVFATPSATVGGIRRGEEGEDVRATPMHALATPAPATVSKHAASPLKFTGQRSTGKTGKLARLFRKQG